MEIKINKDIREYTESMFLGLSVRQSVFSGAAILVSVVIYFWLTPKVGTQIVSWLYILLALPLAALGFVNYHGLKAEELLWVWLKSEFIEPKKLIFESSTIYYDVMKNDLSKKKRELMKSNDKNNSDNG